MVTVFSYVSKYFSHLLWVFNYTRDRVNSALFLISSFYLASEFWTKLSPSPTNYWFIIISQCGVSSNPICIAYKTTMPCVTSGILAVCVTGWISEHQMKKPRLISLEFGFAWLVLCMLSRKWTSSIKRELLSSNSLFASLPLKYLSLQAASHFNLLPTSGDTAGTDVPGQVLSAITDSYFPHWYRETQDAAKCWWTMSTITASDWKASDSLCRIQTWESQISEVWFSLLIISPCQCEEYFHPLLEHSIICSSYLVTL